MFIDFLNKNIEINVIYSLRRGYSLKIIDDNKIEIRIGKKVTEDEIYLMLLKHKRFLINHLDGSHTKNKDIIHVLGKCYDLIINKSDFNNVIINDENNQFILYTKNDNDKYIKRIIDDYYEVVLRDILLKYNDKIREDLNIKFDVKFDFKNVKTYYGQCNKNQKIIILSTNLAKYELKYIISVIYHEYTHFYASGHGDKFYRIIESVFPNYKKTQSNLRKTKYQDLY